MEDLRNNILKLFDNPQDLSRYDSVFLHNLKAHIEVGKRLFHNPVVTVPDEKVESFDEITIVTKEDCDKLTDLIQTRRERSGLSNG